jgi:copper chaperone CopZ
MKKLLMGTAVLLSTAALPLLAGCAAENEAPETRVAVAESNVARAGGLPDAELGPTAELARVNFAVQGMTCGGCAASTKMVLKRLDGVEDAGASYAESAAWASYDPARVTPEQMMEAIRELGYTPTVVEG